jgi:hypothetical protein
LRHTGLSTPSAAVLMTLVSLVLLTLLSCQKVLRTSDSQLLPIQEMLDAQVPSGSSESKVVRFLDTQGYPVEPSEKPGTIVATIRKIDTQRMEPVTARVTFFFDANGKLNTFELQRTMNQPITNQPVQ